MKMLFIQKRGVKRENIYWEMKLEKASYQSLWNDYREEMKYDQLNGY